MGIFQSVKNLVGSSEKENEMRLLRESRIAELRNKQLGNDILVHQMIDQFQNDQIVSFGENIDMSDLYQSFEIDKKECLILVICKKKGLILSEEQPYFVLTDVALYLHLESTSGTPRKKRIVVQDVIKYIVDYDVIDGVIGMYSENESIVILKKAAVTAFFSNNSEVDVMYRILSCIQKYCAMENTAAEKERRRLFSWLEKYVDEHLRTDEFQENIERLIVRMMEEKIVCTEATSLLLRMSLYRKNKFGFLMLLNDLVKSDLSDAEKVIITFRKDLEKYKTELYDLNVDFSAKCLLNMNVLLDQSIRLDEVEKTTPMTQGIIDIYNENILDIAYAMKVRCRPCESLDDYLQSLEAHSFSEAKKNELLTLYFWSANKAMSAVYSMLLDTNCDFEKINPFWRDGYGLTPLHYAMILHHQKAIRYFLEKQLDMLDEDTENEFLQVTLYGVVAVLTENEDVLPYLAMQSDEIRELEKEENSIRWQIRGQKVWSLTMKMGNSIARTALTDDKYGLTDEQEASCMEMMECAPDSIQNAEQTIEELEIELEEIEEQKKMLHIHLTRKWKDYAEKVKSSPSNMVRLYTRLYQDHQLLWESLIAPNEAHYMKMVDDHYVYIYQKILPEADFYEKHYQFDGSVHAQKLYGDSWFSKEAHTDCKLLIKEFHKLAMQYHPDNNQGDLSIFLDIEGEKSKLMEQLTDEY